MLSLHCTLLRFFVTGNHYIDIAGSSFIFNLFWTHTTHHLDVMFYSVSIQFPILEHSVALLFSAVTNGMVMNDTQAFFALLEVYLVNFQNRDPWLKSCIYVVLLGAPISLAECYKIKTEQSPQCSRGEAGGQCCRWPVSRGCRVQERWEDPGGTELASRVLTCL